MLFDAISAAKRLMQMPSWQIAMLGVRRLDNHFSNNLIFLCSYLPSISEVCRRIGINRAQFNKYVSGAVRPSRHNLRKICDFFGVEEFELLLPQDQFEKLIRLRPSAISDPKDSKSELSKSIETLQLNSNHNELKNYTGFYYEYYNSMSVPGKILKSLVHVERLGGVTYYTRHERLQPVSSRHWGARCFYRGHALYLKDKLFMTDYESLTMGEISHTILFPNYKTVIDRLEGLKIGVGAGESNAPATSWVVWDYLGRNASSFRLLRNIGLLDPDDPVLDGKIIERLCRSAAF